MSVCYCVGEVQSVMSCCEGSPHQILLSNPKRLHRLLRHYVRGEVRWEFGKEMSVEKMHLRTESVLPCRSLLQLLNFILCTAIQALCLRNARIFLPHQSRAV